MERFEGNGWKLITNNMLCGYEKKLVNGKFEIFVELDRGLSNRRRRSVKEIEDAFTAFNEYMNNKNKVDQIKEFSKFENVLITGVDKLILSIINQENNERIYI